MMLSAFGDRTKLIVRCAGSALFIVTAVLSGKAHAQSSAQGVPNAMQGFSQNRDQPIQIESATLEMRDKQKQATFAGHVKVVQGDTTMTSNTLIAFYESTGAPPSSNAKVAPSAKTASIPAATPGPGGASSIKRLEAHGNVVVTQKNQVVTGETALFDTTTNLITMRGSVVLSQCKSVMRGDRLLVDMTTGVSRVESDQGKVEALIIQSANDCGSQAPGAGGLSIPAVSNKPK